MVSVHPPIKNRYVKNDIPHIINTIENHISSTQHKINSKDIPKLLNSNDIENRKKIVKKNLISKVFENIENHGSHQAFEKLV